MKTTMIIIISCFFSALSFGQSEGAILMDKLLQQEKMETKDVPDHVKIFKAIKILNAQKERNEISVDEYSEKMNRLEETKLEIGEKLANERMARAKQTKNSKKNSTKADQFDLARAKLKEKLDSGKISQIEYDQRIKNLEQSEKKKKGKE